MPVMVLPILKRGLFVAGVVLGAPVPDEGVEKPNVVEFNVAPKVPSVPAAACVALTTPEELTA